MTTEAISERYRQLDSWPLEQSLATLIDSNRRAIDAVTEALPALTLAAQGIERCLTAGGRLIYLGAGTSGRLALQDAVELLPTFGFTRSLVLLAGGGEAGSRAQEGAEDDRQAARQAVIKENIEERDAVLGIAASGRTPYTVAGLEAAGERGALTIGIANNPGTPLLRAAQIPILLDSGPEVLAGSTRLAAGTAQKIALNALSTAVLVRLGGAYHNLMVGMQATNIKLRSRAVTILTHATGATDTQAQEALEAANWNISEAIVTLGANASPESARRLLKEHHNHVREALAAARKGS